jgi:hypothetical protein
MKKSMKSVSWGANPMKKDLAIQKNVIANKEHSESTEAVEFVPNIATMIAKTKNVFANNPCSWTRSDNAWRNVERTKSGTHNSTNVHVNGALKEMPKDGALNNVLKTHTGKLNGTNVYAIKDGKWPTGDVLNNVLKIHTGKPNGPNVYAITDGSLQMENAWEPVLKIPSGKSNGANACAITDGKWLMEIATKKRIINIGSGESNVFNYV